MKFFKIFLFIILTLLAVVALVFALGFFITGGFLNHTEQLITGIIMWCQLVGFYFYWKVLGILQQRVLVSPRKEMLYWLVTFIIFSLPIMYWGVEKYHDAQIRETNTRYEQEHCVEKRTIRHGYVVKVCDNNTIQGEIFEVEEYLEENKVNQ